MSHFLKTLFLLTALILTSCGAKPLPLQGTWKGTIQLPEIAVPFRMELDLSTANPTGHFIVGNEKTAIPEITFNNSALTFNFSEYGADIQAEWDGNELKGEYRRLRSSGNKTFPFTASPEDRFERRDAPSPTGRFQVLFKDQKPEEAITVATIWKEGPASYYGTFIAPDGDYGLLEGSPTAQGIQFSRVTGWQAIAIELNRDSTEWSGRFHAASNDKPRAFKLTPDPATEPEGKQTAMKNPNAPFAFSCTSLTGEIVRNTDPRFKGKALAVDIMGTWCHNCMDESPVLEKLYKEYGKDGFEVVGLSFEIKDDAELGKKNLTLFRDRFGLTYPLLYCGSLDDANVDKQLKSQLENFFAYPTTLFIDKKGKVQTIHSGFQGPGTGDRYPAQIEKLRTLATKTVQ